MLGTLVNVGAILTGSAIGSVLKRGIGEKYKTIMTEAMGLSAAGLGIYTFADAMPNSEYHVLFIVSLALGGLIGTKLNIAGAFHRAVSHIPGDGNLAQGLSTAILLYCIGTLSILGPIQSALLGEHTFLFTNAMLDGITSIVLASTFGFGIAISAAVLFCWQGSIYFLASLIGPYITDSLMTEVSIIGGLLILSSGLGILKIKEFQTLNLLPALFVPPVAIWLLSVLGIG